ncbi:MAG: hypothetical protein P8O86_00590 [Actinomycetota bacterium]|nr:hypothetical protein [Actinomycetota bacterium]MDG2120254.1 hypothetical protein [Actinomycetota bacterium]
MFIGLSEWSNARQSRHHLAMDIAVLASAYEIADTTGYAGRDRFP